MKYKNNNKNNILMMFKKVLFNDFESMLLQMLDTKDLNGRRKKILPSLYPLNYCFSTIDVATHKLKQK